MPNRDRAGMMWAASDTLLPEPTRPCGHWIARTRKAEAEVEHLRKTLANARDTFKRLDYPVYADACDAALEERTT